MSAITPAQTVSVSSEQAAEWLQKTNRDNRPLRRGRILELASEMLAGRWQCEPAVAPIVFGADGTLYDGQHRLAAIVESKKSVKLRIVYGASLGVREVIDGFAPRSLPDRLAMSHGWRDSPNLRVAILRQTLCPVWKNRTPSMGEILAADEVFGPAIDRLGAHHIHERRITATMLSVLVRAVTAGESADIVASFLQIVRTGLPDAEGRESSAPLLLLRALNNNPVVSNRNTQRSRTLSLTEAALRYYIDGRVIKCLQGGRQRLWIPRISEEGNERNQ